MTKAELIAGYERLRELHANHAEECQIVLVNLATVGREIRAMMEVANQASAEAERMLKAVQRLTAPPGG